MNMQGNVLLAANGERFKMDVNEDGWMDEVGWTNSDF